MAESICSHTKSEKRFLTFSLATIIAVYALILVGGIVRSTGSGMGCPDWPQCFGSWVPPADESELPPDYAEQLTQKRLEKNERFYRLLDRLGIDHAPLSEDHTVGEHIYFNPVKAWIEYLNRVVGVLVGFFIFLTLLFSLKLYKKYKRVTWLSLLTFVLVCFQGWQGSIVVSTNLFPGLITIHMLMALAIVLLLIYTYLVVKGTPAVRLLPGGPLKAVRAVTVLLIMLVLAQIVLGTQIREMIDRIAEAYDYLYRDSWVARTGAVFNVHRDVALAVLVAALLGAQMVRRTLGKEEHLRKIYMAAALLVLLQVVSGILLARFDLLPAMQPVHLLLSSLLLGLLFYFAHGIFSKKTKLLYSDS